MIQTVRKLLAVFIAVAIVDVIAGQALMPFDLGRAVWPLINFPVLAVFPFHYLGVHVYEESLYLWPLHAGMLGVLVYLAVIAIRRLA